VKWELGYEEGRAVRGFWRVFPDWAVVRLVGYDLVQTVVDFGPFFWLNSMNGSIRGYSWPVRHVSVVHVSISARVVPRLALLILFVAGNIHSPCVSMCPRGTNKARLLMLVQRGRVLTATTCLFIGLG